MKLNPGRVVHLTDLHTGRDFEIGPAASAADKALAEQLWQHLSRESRPGRYLVECREHDNTENPELALRRNPDTGRVHGIYVYLRKLEEGTPKERWCVAHFDDRASHEVRANESDEHRREKDAWSDAAEVAGYRADQEVHFSTGVRCDVVIYGPTTKVDIEVQRSHIKTPSAQERTRKAVKAGLMPIWSTDRQTDWTRRNAVPHIRTNALPEHTIRDNWLVVGGMREVIPQRCEPGAFQVCPSTGRGVFCRQFHPTLIPPADGSYRVYEVAELAPTGGLVALNTGRGQGTVLVSPEHHDLWHELANIPAQRSPSNVPQRPRHPHHNDVLRPGYEAVIDRHIATLIKPHPHSPTGEPVCRFEAGTLYCVNSPCRNPNHHQHKR